MGGENRSGGEAHRAGAGSSPRGRGKRIRGGGAPSRQRLIPAWAGKTDSPHRRCAPPAAHPRVGGENKTNDLIGVAADGSSPRGRGKHQEPDFECLGVGLIPAWAGKTWNMLMMRSATGAHPRVGGKTVVFRALPGSQAAHPRVGGENLAVPYSTEIELGSSPRGRGKRLVVILGCCCVGLIPAWAGKTSSGCASSSPHRAHPRVGGENSQLW